MEEPGPAWDLRNLDTEDPCRYLEPLMPSRNPALIPETGTAQFPTPQPPAQEGRLFRKPTCPGSTIPLLSSSSGASL